MSNIILTNDCNLRCPFCFATENNKLDSKKTEDCFSLDDCHRILDFISGKEFRMCGGEPTLNKDLISIVNSLLAKNYSIFLMTNGIWPNTFLNYVKSLSSERQYCISYLFNILHPKFYKKEQWEKLNKTLENVNPVRTTLGITIYKKNFDYSYLIDLAKKYSIRQIRISIAAPNITGKDYITESDYYKIAEYLYQFLLDATKSNLIVTKDCNYIPPCFFKPEHLLNIKLAVYGSWNFTCNHSPVDIDSKGNAWRCYGLYKVLKVRISDFKNEEAIKGFFDRRMRILTNNLYAYKECRDCSFWLKGCLGGCLSIRIKKILKENPDLVLFPIDDKEEILKCKPVKDKYLTIKSLEGNSKVVFYKKSFINNPDENVIDFLEEIDGEKTISDLINKWQLNFDSYDETKEEVIAMCKYLFEKDMINIKYDYGIKPGLKPKKIEPALFQ